MKSDTIRCRSSYASADVSIEEDVAGGLAVTIDSERLQLRSLTADPDSLDSFVRLQSDPQVMRTYAAGQIKTPQQSTARYQVLADRWRSGDPFSGFGVYLRDTDDYVGTIGVGHSGLPGTGEIYYLLAASYWGRRYGSESAHAVVDDYLPKTVTLGYLLDGQPIHTVQGTCLPDNLASLGILNSLGLHEFQREHRHGALRLHYRGPIALSEG